jgi:N-acetylated-alpha-linked acidic dipeptidase
VEHHAAELRETAIVYINSDSNSRGFLYAGGSHTLEPFVNQVARSVIDPQTGVSVLERARAALRLDEDAELRARAEQGGDLPLDPLGSGSDYTPFLQHLAIASLNVGFDGEGQYGQYHSAYDSFDHYRRFMDPGFEYGVALAAVGGRLVTRLANAEVLPLAFGPLASTVATYVDEVEELLDTLRDETSAENRRIADGVYEVAWDPTEERSAPQAKGAVPYLAFAPLRNSLARLEDSARSYDAAYRSQDGATPLSTDWRRDLGRRLALVERALSRDHGLPGRPWFVHHVYAPGFYTGYGVKTLPGVREAIEQRDWEQAEEQVEIAADVLEAAAEAIDDAREVLERSVEPAS